jgi:hypothetical protein
MKSHSLRITLIAAALALLCPLLLRANGMERDMLLASDGTLYTVESVASDSLSGVKADSTHALVLTVQNGSDSTVVPVPASLSDGYHFAPTLAYDAVTKTLFIFWETMRNSGFTSDLSFCSYRNGEWGNAATLDSVAWDLRENLRVAITRKTEQRSATGEVTLLPEVTVHAVWWQQSGSAEWARYAMLPTDNGDVRMDSIQVQNLSDFISKPEAVLNTASDNEILRHPLVIESPGHDTVDVVFGDVSRDSMHRITLKPVANGRLRIPVGVKDGSLPTPNAIANSTAGISGTSSTDGSLAFYFSTPKALSYLLYKNGGWSPLRSLPLSDKLSSEAAVDALRRMMESE